jgi:hypothetical protein
MSRDREGAVPGMSRDRKGAVLKRDEGQPWL